MACKTTLSRTQRPFTNKCCASRLGTVLFGLSTKPSIANKPASALIAVAAFSQSTPSTAATRAGHACTGQRCTARLLCVSCSAMSLRASPSLRTASRQCAYSVASDFKKRRLAGVLKNSSATVTVVPSRPLTGSEGSFCPPSVFRRNALGAPWGRLVIDKRATEAIEASASPRKPKLVTDSRSENDAIFDVACRANASGNSATSMPRPSSATCISTAPPPTSSTSMARAPPSTAFSSNSLSAAAGRSMTSPAAIWLTR